MSYVRDNQCKAIKKNGKQCGGGKMPGTRACGPHQNHPGPWVEAEATPVTITKTDTVEVPRSILKDMVSLAESSGDEDLAYVLYDLANNH